MGQLRARDLDIIHKSLDMLYRIGVVNYGDYLDDFFPDDYTLGQIRDEFEETKKKIKKIMRETSS